MSPLSPSSAQSLFASSSTPPLSPRSGGASGSSGSPLSPKSPMQRQGTAPAPTGSPTLHKPAEAVPQEVIPPYSDRVVADCRLRMHRFVELSMAWLSLCPQFYFPDGSPPARDVAEEWRAKLDELFHGYPDGLPPSAFQVVTKEVCQLPSYFNSCLFHKVDPAGRGSITREAFVKFWVESHLILTDLPTRVFAALKQPNREHLTQDDFKPLLRELLNVHPGLEFLHDTPEFQDRYAETVIYRIFYHVNRSGNGRMLLKELKRSNLVAALQQVDEEEDINKILRYFSYEHFYVIYCKFWELDSDHDFLIDKDDLLRYGNHALTYRIVERIFSQVPRRFTSRVEGKMGYEDFVWFILSEEDKSSEPSLEYWFKCVDMDCDSRITPNEMQYFYEEQLHRMECMAQDPVLFEDIVCQMADMINPAVSWPLAGTAPAEELDGAANSSLDQLGGFTDTSRLQCGLVQKEGQLTLRDLKRCKLAGNFFNILFNLNKFVAFETRDPFLIRQEREDPTLTEWDRFARAEYIRLSMEDEGEDASNGSAEVWDESLESPF
eukprot:SM000152S01572  [mRNA]  locus=s152:288904:292553:- [translate_table: standard]